MRSIVFTGLGGRRIAAGQFIELSGRQVDIIHDLIHLIGPGPGGVASLTAQRLLVGTAQVLKSHVLYPETELREDGLHEVDRSRVMGRVAKGGIVGVVGERFGVIEEGNDFAHQSIVVVTIIALGLKNIGLDQDGV